MTQTLNLPGGLTVRVLREAPGGRQLQNGDRIGVYYEGRLLDGSRFDGNISFDGFTVQRSLFAFNLGQNSVIQGWEQGLRNRRVGEVVELTIPANLAYGSSGTANIPPNSTLIFRVIVAGMLPADQLNLPAAQQKAIFYDLNALGLQAADLGLTAAELSALPATASDPGLLMGTELDDTINGQNGQELIAGLQGNDRLKGGGGRDALSGGDGQDALESGADDDWLSGGKGDDSLDGGAGSDSYVVSGRDPDAGPSSSFQGFDTYADSGAASDGIDSIQALDSGPVDIGFRSFGPSSGIERIINATTGAAQVRLLGNAEANLLDFSGTALVGGNFLIDGAGGADTLRGSALADRLRGGQGRDELTGGASGDTFLYGALSDSAPGKRNRDLITDFSGRQGDRIDLRSIDANSRKGGDQAFRYIKSASFGGKAGELRYSKGLLAGDVNGDRKADLEISLTGNPNLLVGHLLL